MVKYTETLRQKRVFLSSFRYAQSIRDIEELERPFREVGDALNELCFHSFSVVRICAQRHRLFVDTRFPWLAQNRLLNSTISKLGLASQGRSEELTGAVYLCGNEFNVSQISKRWNLFSKFLTTIVCESPQAISMLPVHRQVKAQERVAKLLHGVLQKWHQYAKNAIPAGEMAQLLLNLSIVGNDPTVHWRRQLGICAVIGILIDPRFENDIPRETVSFVVNMAQCEILPSRTVALSVLRRLLLCGDSCRMLVANEISSKPAEFWLLAGATLAEDRNSAAADDQQADWSVGVGEFIKLVRSLVRRPKFQKDDMILQVNNFSSLSIIDILTIKIAPKDFHAPKADFWAALSSLRYANNIDLLSSVALPTLKRLSTEGESNKDRMIRRMAACELFAGCLMVYPEWSTSFFPILSRMLAELPNASNWCDAASFIAFFSKDSGTSLLMDLNKEMDKRIAATSISDEPETEGEKIIGFAYTSNLLKVLGSLVLDRKQQVSGEMFAKFEKFLLHPYKAVRQSASTSIAAFSAFQIVKHEEATRAILATVSKSKDGLEAGLLFVAVACALGEAKRILTSLIIPLISVVFQAQGHEDLETANLAKNVLTVVASLKCFAVPIKAVEFEQKVCNDYAGHSEWPKRRAAAIFLRTFHSQHSCLLLGLGGGGLVQKTAENLLNDTQAEVRDAARSLLVSLLAGVSPVSLFSAHERYLRMIARPETIKKKQGVLALTALVEACPYSVPSAIPPSVVELSKHVNGTNGTQVKKTLSEFRRTHIDEWADHKKAFSQEQLDELEGVLVSPDYYA